MESPLLASWRISLRARRLSPQTIDAYLTDATGFAAHLAATGVADLADATRRDVEGYLVACQDRGLADATVARRYRSLLQLYRWLADEDEIAASPMAKMSPPAVTDRPPRFPTDAELAALLAACADKAKASNGRHGRHERDRDTALVTLLALSGVRAGEIMGMHVADVHLAAGTFTVTGKGAKTRTLPLMTAAIQALDRYLRARRTHPHASEPWLWLGEKGRFTDWGLRQMLERRCADAGIERINPHAFRHRFTHLAKLRGMSDEDIMAHNDWASPQMLHRYGRSARAERARDAYRAAFGDDLL